MRTLSFAVASVAALATGPALAADLGVPARAPAAAVAPIDFTNWNGFYIGAMGGYGWGRTYDVTNTLHVDTDGPFVGGTIGFNFQPFNSPFVFGIEADAAWADITGNNVVFGRSTLEAFGTVRGRIGWAFGNLLAYGTGGFAWGDNRITIAGVGSSNTHTGFTYGGGLEWAFSPNWSAKVEYLYLEFGRETYFPNAGAFVSDFHVHTVKGGINYRFNWGAPSVPVAARY